MYCPACQSEYPADWKACPKDATHLLKSAQIGKYRIEGLLGVGGMGAVYRAINPDTQGRVAIKVMNPAVAGAEAARARFQREAAAVAALRTSHVVKVYDFGSEPDGTLYLVMELLDGHPLRDEIEVPPDTMNVARVQMVLDGALKGLAAAHRAGIVHRDLKPENVYVADTDDGEVPKLLDFGIARVRTRGADLTRTGSLMGTAAYMAPEQIAVGVGEIGPWSDVYAMGAIMYEMLAGTSAYGGETVTEVLTNALKGEVVPLATVRADLPPAIYELVARCMSPDPAKRPQDAEQMRAALERARLVPHGTQVPPASRTQTEPARTSLGLGLGHEATQAPRPPAPVPQSAMAAPIATSSTDSVMRGPRRRLWPFVLAGALVAGTGALVVVKGVRGSGPDASPDAAVVVAIDSAAPDAAVVVALDAAVAGDAETPAVTAGMIRIPAGDYEVGEDPKGDPAALAKQTVHTEEVWIDSLELTLGQLQAALGTTAGGAAGDAPELPARRVTWDQANTACEKLGKRLPTELEWEIAARLAPGDAASATLLRGKPGLVATPKRECSSAGLCDVIGSVAEWTSTSGSATTKIARGASYMVAPTSGWHATIHARAQVKAKSQDDELGVRCAYGAGATPESTTEPAKPKPAKPKPPPKPKPKCDDLDQLRKSMRIAFGENRNAEALAAAETLIACGQSGAGVMFHAAVAACRLGDAAKARLHAATLPNPRKQLVRNACRRTNIELP